MVQQRPFLRRHGSTLIFAVVLACGVFFLSKNSVARYDIWQHQRLWNHQHLANYRYMLSVSSMGMPDLNQQMLIEVHNHQPTRVIPIDSQRPVTSAEQAQYTSIDRLFQVMVDAINRRVDHVRVDYDSHLNYPIEISIDPSARQVDDEIHYSIRDFEVLP